MCRVFCCEKTYSRFVRTNLNVHKMAFQKSEEPRKVRLDTYQPISSTQLVLALELNRPFRCFPTQVGKITIPFLKPCMKCGNEEARSDHFYLCDTCLHVAKQASCKSCGKKGLICQDDDPNPSTCLTCLIKGC